MSDQLELPPYATISVVHIKQHPDAVPIDRTTKFGNKYWENIPQQKMDTYPIGEDHNRIVPHNDKVAAYGTQIMRQVKDGEISMWDLWELRNKKIGCWCKDDRKPANEQKSCHGDVLREVVIWACHALAGDGQIHHLTGEKMVMQFKGAYQWLSNMHICQPFVDEHGNTHKYSETYYMAEKFSDPQTKKALSQMNGFEAKKYSQILLPNPGQEWHSKKDDVMRRAIRYKFQDPELRKKLLDTEEEFLVEGNYHNDKYWGFCLKTGAGLNKLGQFLMELRSEIRQEIAALKATIESSQ